MLLVFDHPAELDAAEPGRPNTIVLLFNADGAPLSFRLPPLAPDERWELLMDTSVEDPKKRLFRSAHRYPLADHTTAVLRKTDLHAKEER